MANPVLFHKALNLTTISYLDLDALAISGSMLAAQVFYVLFLDGNVTGTCFFNDINCIEQHIQLITGFTMADMVNTVLIERLLAQMGNCSISVKTASMYA